MGYLIKFLFFTYSYCTDFIINLANLSGLSYYEINFIVFIILYPLLIAASGFVFFIQKVRLFRLRKSGLK